MRVSAAFLIVMAASLALAADGRGQAGTDWPSFRCTPDMAGVAHSALPDKLERLWTYEAGSAVTSTAAIVGGRVFVGTDDGEVLCLDLRDGLRLI